MGHPARPRSLAVTEGKDWLLNATAAPPGNQSRWMLSLSRGGSDAVTLREFGSDTKLFIYDGFVLPEAKGSGVWLDFDTLVLLSSRGDGMAATTGYARTVRLWRRGTQVDKAAVIFETKAAHVSVGCSVDDIVVPPEDLVPRCDRRLQLRGLAGR
ncbi:prolyl oligopeptidase PreP (S9A serine peptidase family) [Bradyrhizobium sp. LM6.10]